MGARLAALAVLVAVVLGGLYYVRHINAERAALAVQVRDAQARAQAQAAAAAAARQQQERSDATAIELQQRATDLARIRDGLAGDLVRSLRQSAAGARGPRMPAVSAAARAVPGAAAGAGVQPPAARDAAADSDAAWERFNATVDRLARHAEAASGAADTAAAERNAIARIWDEYHRADQARREALR